MRDYSRRKFLKRAMQTGAFSPFLTEVTSRTALGGDSGPLRFISVYNPNGFIRGLWKPRQTGENYDPKEFTFDFENSLMRPLVNYKDSMIIFDGFDYKVLYQTTSTGHFGGPATSLTGAPGYDNNRAPVTSQVPQGSIDQYIAAVNAANYPFPSLELGVGNWYQPMSNSYAPGGARLPMITDPFQTYAKLYANSGESENEMRLRLLRRQSVLDSSSRDLSALLAKVDGDSRNRLATHLDAIRSIENSLSENIVCSAMDAPRSYDVNSQDQYADTIIKLQIDLLVEALACGQSLVGNLSLNVLTMPFIPGLNIDIHHEIAHRINDVNPDQENLTSDQQKAVKMYHWYADIIKYLMDKLSSRPEGNGYLVDNSLVYWYNELSDPNDHSNMNMPLVMLGGGGGKFKMGQWIKGSQDREWDCTRFWATPTCNQGEDKTKHHTAHNHILVSILNGFGIGDDRFGSDEIIGGVNGVLR